MRRPSDASKRMIVTPTVLPPSIVGIRSGAIAPALRKYASTSASSAPHGRSYMCTSAGSAAAAAPPPSPPSAFTIRFTALCSSTLCFLWRGESASVQTAVEFRLLKCCGSATRMPGNDGGCCSAASGGTALERLLATKLRAALCTPEGISVSPYQNRSNQNERNPPNVLVHDGVVLVLRVLCWCC